MADKVSLKKWIIWWQDISPHLGSHEAIQNFGTEGDL